MEGLALVLPVLMTILFVTGSIHALPLEPLFLSQLTEQEGELFLGDKDTEMGAQDSPYLVEKLQHHAESITTNTQQQIEDTQEFPPIVDDRQTRQKRETVVETDSILSELQSVFFELLQINKTATFPVAYPHDVETLYYNDELYVIATGIADPSTTSEPDTIFIFYYDDETNTTDLVVTHTVLRVHDVDYFSYNGDYYIVATEWSDAAGNDGCIMVLLWNVGAPRDSQSLTVIQNVESKYPVHIETFVAGDTQFIITSEMQHDLLTEAAVMYEWKGGHMDEFAVFPKTNITSIVPIQIHSKTFIAIASKADADGNYATYSYILVFNVHMRQFEVFQAIRTFAAIDMASFLLGSGLETEAFLLIANAHSEKGGSPRSIIYKYNEDRFEPFQCLAVSEIFGWHLIKDGSHLASLIIYTADAVRFYEYDGWVFGETTVQFYPPGIVALPVTAMSSHYNRATNTADLVVASNQPADQALTLFRLEMLPTSLADRFNQEALAVCKVEEVTLRTINTKYINITQSVDEVVFKDIGTFVYNGNVTFLGNVSAGDSVIREVVVLDGPILTKEEEAQLEELREMVANSTNYLQKLLALLPNTMLVNTTAQTIPGAKTFSSITAEGDITPDTLTVTSNTVNGDIDLQEISDTYIDTALPQVLDITMTLAGGADILGDLGVTGLVDGVDMDDVVTLSGDHTITGAKTFGATFTAQNDLDVTGTVDGVTLTSAAVLMTSGAQTVTGSFTFDGGLTANEDVSVTGDVDTVDLSELADSAFYLDGDNIVTGDLLFTGPVTMDGLNTASGTTVDGLDFDDIVNILRISVEQNITAKYTFTDALTIYANITVAGLVNDLSIPSDVVLIDDPNPVIVEGPIVFDADMNVSCLSIKDTLNNINVPSEYSSLDLFLTAPKNDKNSQRLQGLVDFETDITILANSSLSGRLDGVDLEEMADDTVYITGDQQITGVKTFSGDMKIGSNLTVGMLINGVDINDLDDNSVKLSEGVIDTLGTLDFNGDVLFEAAVTTGGSHTFGDTLTLSDLVTQHTDETVGGAKTFTQSVTSESDVSVTSNINTVAVDTLYSDAVQLDASSSVTVTATWGFSNDVDVDGDLSVTGNIDGIDLDDAVTIQGAQTITGPTTFSGTLTSTASISIAGDLTLSDGTVNGYDVTDVDSDTLKCSGAQTVTGRKTFDALTVNDNIVISGNVDGVDVSDIYANAVFISGDQSISGVKTFSSETSFENMVFNGLVDGISIPEFFSTVLTQGTVQTVQGQVTTTNVLVKADVTVNDEVNGLVIEDLWDYSAKTTDSTYAVEIQFAEVESGDDVQTTGTVDGIVISRDVATADATGQAFTGKKTFLSPPLFKGDIAVVNVNDVDILDLWTRTVKNIDDQVITASKTFNAGITVNGDISVTGTVDGVDVADLANRAVLTSSSDPSAVQTITADVTFTDVRALQDINYSGLLQTVNIQSLDSSYVSRSASDQTITADKTFSDSVTVVTGGSLDVDSLDLDGTLNGNDMDTLYDDAWINGGSTTVYDTKTFDQCVTMEDDLTVDGLVDGVDISGNVMTTDLNQQVTGFKIFTVDLTIDENLKFQTGNQIDGVDVSDWESNAARLDSTETVAPDMTFENIDFEESVSVTGTCNGLNFSPATFMTKSRDQDVTAVKTFQYGVAFTGNMDVTGTVQGADVVEIDTNSLLTSSDQTLQGSFVFEVGPTFSDITTTALIDGEDVVELFMRLNDLPDLEGFEDFMENHCNLLNDMHDAFENQAYILRYPEMVQTIRTNGRANWRAYYYNGTQWLMQARTKISIDYPDDICINSFIYQWSDAEGKYNVFKTLTLDFAEDAVFFEEEGYLFLAIITSNYSKDCEVINLLPSDAQPSRNPDFQRNVSPSIFHDISDFIVLIYLWSPELEDFLVYQSLTGVGSVSVDYYIDPILNESCLALANHRSFNAGNMTTDVMSAVYCMESVAGGFSHSAVIDTLGAVKILPFVYDNVLHLVVANRLDTAQRTFMVESTIWGNFIKEVAIPTSAVSDVAVHGFHGNYFVAFANEFEGQLQFEDYDVPISIYTYEYDPEGDSSVSLMQEIPAYRVQSLEFFEVYDQLFLVVVNRSSSVTIFRYKGMELFKVIHTIPLAGAANVEVYPFKNDPENLHIAATAYMERASVIPGSPIRTRTVDSSILSLYFQGFDTDTIGCTNP